MTTGPGAGGLLMAGLYNGIGAANLVTDAFQEWHVYPQATYISAQNATYIGGIGGSGTVTANVFDHGAGVTRRTIGGSAVVDDHCRPSLWVSHGRRSLLLWTNHNADGTVRLKVGSVLNAPSDLASLSSAVEQSVSGVSVSYTQVHRIESLSGGATDEFVVFSRYTSGSVYTWKAMRLTVNQATGVATWGAVLPLFSFSGTQQGYLNTVPAHNAAGNQRIRMVAFYNPTATTHGVCYFEMDMVTGSIYDDDQTTVLGNLYTGVSMPIVHSTITAAIPTGSNDVRMFALRPGPATPAILWGSFNPSGPLYSGSYLLREMTSPGVWGTDVNFGSPGVVIGYQGDKHYHAGGTFPNPDPDGLNLYLGREKAGTWTVEKRTFNGTDWNTKVYTAATPQTEAKVARPEAALNGGAATYPIIVTQVTLYGGDVTAAYTIFAGNLKGLTGASVPLIPFNLTVPTITTDLSPNTGETVTAVGGTWENTPTTIEFAWARDTVGGVPIASGGVPQLMAGAAGTFGVGNTSYTLTAGDELHNIYLMERATNAAGTNLAFSDPIIPIAPPPAGSLVDTFGAASTTVLSSHTADSGETWTKRSGTGTQSCIVAGRLRGATTAISSVYSASWVPTGADYLVLAQLGYPSGASGMKFGGRVVTAAGTDPGSGVTVAAGDGYFADHDYNNSIYRIFKIINGVQSANLATAAASGNSTRWTALKLTGTTLKMFYADDLTGLFAAVNANTPVCQVDDTDLTAKGTIGTYAAAAAFTDSTRVQISEIQGRN